MRSAQRTWTSQELSEDLRASVPLVNGILADFVRRGLITADRPGTFRYDPKTPETASCVTELARLYAERPLAIIKEILAAPDDSIQSFVAAFRVKKD